MTAIPAGDDWVALTDAPLRGDPVTAWATLPRCGAVVTFLGTVRDHGGDPADADVTALEYEAYDGPAVERLHAVATEARLRWPTVGRIAIIHRTGRVDLADTAVVVTVSAPHRGEAFDAARWCIDTVKATAPIWKKEHRADHAAWVTPVGTA